MAPDSPRPPTSRSPQLEAFQVVCVIVGLVVLPTALTLRTVQPGGSR